MNVISGLAFSPPAPSSATDYMCWTRMQAEAGQGLERIIHRKEQERLAGDGLFFWGVGNAPSTMIRALSRMGAKIPVVFSVMKGKPKAIDEKPDAVVAWNGYIDNQGVEQTVPEHVLVTSRRDSAGGPKRSHYALMCFSALPLELRTGLPFDHRRYRNAGVAGGMIGASQVTALIEPGVSFNNPGQADYHENLVAELTGSYWVKLTRPSAVSAELVSLDFEGKDSYARAVRASRKPLPCSLSPMGTLL